MPWKSLDAPSPRLPAKPVRISISPKPASAGHRAEIGAARAECLLGDGEDKHPVGRTRTFGPGPAFRRAVFGQHPEHLEGIGRIGEITHPFLDDAATAPSRAGQKGGGDGGIRTHETVFPPTPLAGERLRPLGHISTGSIQLSSGTGQE